MFFESNLWSKVIPMNFARGKYESCIPYKNEAGLSAVSFRVLENMINLAFSGFSFIFHLAHHSANASRSFCNLSADRDALLLPVHRPVSSANLDLEFRWCFGSDMSLT